MKNSGLTDFQVSLGHVDYFRALTEEAQLTETQVEELRHLMAIQNRFGVQEYIQHLQLRRDLEEAFCRMPEQFGGIEMLQAAQEKAGNQRCREAIDRLVRIYELLKLYGCEHYITFDLGMTSQLQYYTGIIFQAYTYGSGDALIKGGRYNRLIERFGKKADAVGFATEVDQLLLALDRQHVSLPVEDIKTMVLYPVSLEPLAIRFSAAQRKKGIEAACVRFQADKVLDDYRRYGSRNQFGGIIYFRSAEEVYAINLKTGETKRIEVKGYM